MKTLLLATDLDRTILPNGTQEEPENARNNFRKYAEQDFVTLVYISGRGKQLLQDAITEYSIPLPAYAIGDVGTTIFVTHDTSWKPLPEWEKAIAKDWNGNTHADVQKILDGIDGLRLQEDEKQNTFKLSYYTPENINRDAVIATMRTKLKAKRIEAALIWSIDGEQQTGLMDVLPKSATKLHALTFLMDFLGFHTSNTVFCGDSGNDMPALTSGINAVLVANARDEIKTEASATLKKNGKRKTLYIAQQNYSAGVLEGVAHFFPDLVVKQ